MLLSGLMATSASLRSLADGQLGHVEQRVHVVLGVMAGARFLNDEVGSSNR